MVNDNNSNLESVKNEEISIDAENSKEENEVTNKEIESQSDTSETESKDALDGYNQTSSMGADDVKHESIDIKNDINNLEITRIKSRKKKKRMSISRRKPRQRKPQTKNVMSAGILVIPSVQ